MTLVLRDEKEPRTWDMPDSIQTFTCLSIGESATMRGNFVFLGCRNFGRRLRVLKARGVWLGSRRFVPLRDGLATLVRPT